MDLPTLGAKALEGCWCRREFIDWLHRLVFCVLSINSTGDDDNGSRGRGRTGNTVKRAGQWFGLLLLRMNALLCFALLCVESAGPCGLRNFPVRFSFLFFLLSRHRFAGSRVEKIRADSSDYRQFG